MDSAEHIINQITKHPNCKAIITTHHKPDADALGSSLGLLHFLEKLSIQTTVISPTDFAGFLSWMPQSSKICIFEENEPNAEKLCLEADFIFCLDFNNLSRINKLGDIVQKTKAQKILIDHHQFPQSFEQLNFWDEKASSTCELIYRLITESKNTHLIDKNIASCLYAGIMTDTGSFRFSNCTAQTHKIAAHLMDYDINHVAIHDKLHDSFTLDRVRFIGYAISQKLEVLEEFNTALITINKDELKQYNIKTGDTEGLVNYGLSIQGIKFAALIIDRTQLVKMSFRSKGNFPANIFASKFFNGGGHFNAAGGSSESSLEDTVNKFRDALTQFKGQLNEEK